MAKTNNLKDYLTDLYEGIASKKPNASRNPQDFRSEIESISGGATIKSGGSGTPVPNNAYVENVYLNTDLSIAEVVSILKQINLENGYLVFLGQNEEGAVIGYNMAGLNEYIISDSNNNVYFSDVDGGWGFIGWNTNITNPIVVNSEVLSEIGSTTIGTQNSQLAQLFSITPFTKEEIELSGEYDGSTIEVTDLSGGWQGTNVVNGQFVEKLYINNNLSIEELYAICDTLDFEEEAFLYNVFYSENQTKALQIMDLRNFDGKDYGVIIAYAVQGDQPQLELIFSTSPLLADFTGFDFTDGWYNTSKDFYIEVNANADEDGIVEETGHPVNANDTSQLISTTPFTKTEENTINIKKYIDNKQIPLSIKVNVEGGTPIELTTSDEMDAVLTSANIGKIYKYTGTTNDTYTNGELYQVVEEA